MFLNVTCNRGISEEFKEYLTSEEYLISVYIK